MTALRTCPPGLRRADEPGAGGRRRRGLVVLGQHLGPRELVALVLVSLASVGVTLGQRSIGPPRKPLGE
jgi:inner membrane transporter RhtA